MNKTISPNLTIPIITPNFNKRELKGTAWGTQLAQSGTHATLDLGVMGLSPMWGYYLKKIRHYFKKKPVMGSGGKKKSVNKYLFIN